MPLCSPQLLVNNKIISLDLSVAEVYKKVWCPTNEVRVQERLAVNEILTHLYKNICNSYDIDKSSLIVQLLLVMEPSGILFPG